jgi:biopolymer transport protein ExbD
MAGSESDVGMRMVRNLQTGFGLLYCVTLLLLVVPAVMVFGQAWGLYPHSVGVKVHIAPPESFMGDQQAPVIVTVHCAKEGGFGRGEPEFRLSSQPVSPEDLRATLREQLSRHPHPVVYVEADGCLTLDDVMRVVDIARDAWYGVPVVLLTPKTRKMLDLKRDGH